MRIALTRRPGPELVACELTHLDREPIDVARAQAEHDAYRAFVASRVDRHVDLPALEGAPDAVFVEDAAVVLDDVAILPRLGAPSRRVETPSVADALAPYRELVFMEAPTTLDGGDVLHMGDTLYVGWSGRTNHDGLRDLAHRVLDHGYQVKAVEVSGCLHLKSAICALDEETVLVNRRWLHLDRVRGLELVDVHEDEPWAANCLAIGGTVALASAFPRTAERVAARGYEVTTLDVAQMAKAEAGLTCMSLVFEAAP